MIHGAWLKKMLKLKTFKCPPAYPKNNTLFTKRNARLIHEHILVTPGRHDLGSCTDPDLGSPVVFHKLNCTYFGEKCAPCSLTPKTFLLKIAQFFFDPPLTSDNGRPLNYLYPTQCQTICLLPYQPQNFGIKQNRQINSKIPFKSEQIAPK